MGCKYDFCVVGRMYQITGGYCRGCKTPAQLRVGCYRGINPEGFHVFILTRPVRCSGCGDRVIEDWISCSDDGAIDVTEEFQKVTEPFAWLDAIRRKNSRGLE